MNSPSSWSSAVPTLIAAGYAAVDHRTPEIVVEQVTDDFELTMVNFGGQVVDREAFAQVMEVRKAAAHESRHLVSNLRALGENENEVRLGYVLTVHRLEPDAHVPQTHLSDVEETWSHVDDGWRLASRSLTMSFPRLYDGSL
ncbi:MAG: nuclear transport factor 2 family protein [Dermatophilaceae bacterium]